MMLYDMYADYSFIRSLTVTLVWWCVEVCQ